MNRQIDGHGAPEGPMDPDRAGFLRRREVWAVLALAAIVRVAYWASKWNDRLLFNDSLYYSGQAIKMFHGQWFRDPFFDLPAADHGPVTTLLMAPLSGGSDPWRWQRLITVMTGLVLVAVVMRWTTEMVSRRAGIAAGILAALYPNLWMNDGLVMSESVALAFLVTASWLAWRALRQWEGGPRALRSWWSAGAVFGLAALTRSEIALIAVVVVAWCTWRERRCGAWRALVALGLVALPWVAYNTARFDRQFLLTTNEGGALLGSNCDATWEGTHLGGWSIFCFESDLDYDHEEDPSVRSVRQRSLAIDYVMDHRSGIPKVLAARVLRTFDIGWYDSQLQQDTGEERPSWAVWAGIVAYWAVLPLSLLGLRRLPSRDRPFLLAPVVVTLLTALVFYAGHRLRVIGEPALVIAAAIQLAALWERRRPATVGD